jgi:16S rRNA (uracil1498-N3)-methyltransferase
MRQLHHPLPEGPIPAELDVDREVRHRLERVLRLPLGSLLTLADGTGRRVQVRWHGAHFRVEAAPTQAQARPTHIELAVGLIKGERWDWLIEKATEVGVDRIVPLQLEHCVVRVDAAKAVDKTARWQAIATEAFEQCGRDRLPEVSAPQRLEAWLDTLAGVTLAVCDERGAPTPLLALAGKHPQRLVILVGPEGGLTESERQRVLAAGAVPVTLGRDVLRAETAALVAVALARQGADR